MCVSWGGGNWQRAVMGIGGPSAPSGGSPSLALRLPPQVSELLEMVHLKLQEVPEETVRKATQQTVCILASQHKAAVVSSLLGHPLPLDR